MHEELLRRSAQRIVGKEVESERKRKLGEMEKMTKGEAEHEMEMAQTNENLSKLQLDLKNAFKIMNVSKGTSWCIFFKVTTVIVISSWNLQLVSIMFSIKEWYNNQTEWQTGGKLTDRQTGGTTPTNRESLPMGESDSEEVRLENLGTPLLF